MNTKRVFFFALFGCLSIVLQYKIYTTMFLSQCILVDELHRYAPYGFTAIFKMFHNIPEHDVLDMFREASDEVLIWVRSKTPERERKIATLLDMVMREKSLFISK